MTGLARQCWRHCRKHSRTWQKKVLCVVMAMMLSAQAPGPVDAVVCNQNTRNGEDCNINIQAGAHGMLQMQINWTSAVAYPSYDIVVFDPRKAMLDFSKLFPYDSYVPFKKVRRISILHCACCARFRALRESGMLFFSKFTIMYCLGFAALTRRDPQQGVTGYSITVSQDNAHEFCYKSSCLSDDGLAELTFLIQVLGIDGAITDESAIRNVQPRDGISPPREVTLCGIEDRNTPCDGSIAIQLSQTLRLAFKYPETLARHSDAEEYLLPSHILCEFSTNASNFASGLAFSQTFPYDAGLRPSQAAFVRLYIPIPLQFLGVSLSCRIRMPNHVGPGYFGISGRQVAALQPPSEPSIAQLKPAVHPVDGQALLVQIRRPVDLGDGGRGTALALVFQIYIANSGSEEVNFETGSTPPYAIIYADPSAQVTNVTLSVSNFDPEDRASAAAILATRSIAFVWVRASNQRNDNPKLSSKRSTGSSVLLASTPGPVGVSQFRITANLAAILAWTPPADKGVGLSYDYPILSYQYAEVEPDLTRVYDIVTVGASISSVQLSPLQKGKMYFYSVRAVNDVGAGPWFLHVDCAAPLFDRPSTCGVVALSHPHSPTVDTLQQGEGFLNAIFRYPSDPGTRPSRLNISLTYKVQFQGNGSIINASTDQVTSLRFNESLGQVKVGSYYRFRCMALNQVGSSQWSPWSLPTVMLARPSSPILLSVSPASPIGPTADYRFSFHAPLDTGAGGDSWPIILYEITVTPDSAGFNPNGDECSRPDVAILNGTTTMMIASKLTSGCDYRFVTRARNFIGFGPEAYTVFEAQVSSTSLSLSTVHRCLRGLWMIVHLVLFYL